MSLNTTFFETLVGDEIMLTCWGALAWMSLVTDIMMLLVSFSKNHDSFSWVLSFTMQYTIDNNTDYLKE
jgi:hypothetical protein